MSSCTQRVKINGVCSSSVDVLSGVRPVCPRIVFLVLCCFLLYIAALPELLKNVLVVYADDSTLFCKIPYPHDRASVAASLNDELAMISDWCSRWGMLVIPSKTRGMLIFRSHKVEPLFYDLEIDGSFVKMVSELMILGVILTSKLVLKSKSEQLLLLLLGGSVF